METVLPRSWKEEFALAAAVRREDILYREKMTRFENREREKREEFQIEEQRRDREDIAAFEAALAPQEQIVEFRHQLDDYDTKTVDALMDNRVALDAVQEKMETMRGQAYVLPDGRRVFKTADGKQVFDEHGLELSPAIIDPQTIDDKKPKWEAFKGVTDDWTRLREERQQLIDYQTKLDEARARLDKGEITNKDLKDLKADLSENMPEAVRLKLAMDDPSKAAPSQNASLPSALPSDMDNLMRQTGLAKPGPA